MDRRRFLLTSGARGAAPPRHKRRGGGTALAFRRAGPGCDLSPPMTTWSRLSLGLLLLALTASASTGAEPKPKRVLIVHSFGSTAPPFTTHSTAFQTTLTKELGERVDMDEVSLDMARYAQPDMEGPFVEFLLARLAKWQPDLVVPIGSPAGRFVVKYRDRLFPGRARHLHRHGPAHAAGTTRSRATPPSSASRSTSRAWSRTFSSSRPTRTTSPS